MPQHRHVHTECSRQRREQRIDGCCSALPWCESQHLSCAMPELRLPRLLASPAFQKGSGGLACVRKLRGVACALGSCPHELPSQLCESAAKHRRSVCLECVNASAVARLILCHGCGIANAARCETACAPNPSSLCVLNARSLPQCIAQALARPRQAHWRELTSSSWRASPDVGRAPVDVQRCAFALKPRWDRFRYDIFACVRAL